MSAVPPTDPGEAAGGVEAVALGLGVGGAGLGSLFEASSDAMAIHRQGTVLAVNRACLDLLGIQASEQAVGRDLDSFLAHGSRYSDLDCAEGSGRDGHDSDPSPAVTRRQVHVRRTDGATVHVEVHCIPVTVAGEAASLLQLINPDLAPARDDEERERLVHAAKEALAGQRRSEQLLEVAEWAAGLGVWEWDITSGQLAWTAGLEPLHGLEPGTFRGTFEHFSEVIHEEDRLNVLRDIESALQGHDEFETEFRVTHQDGSIHWVLGKGRVLRESTTRPLRMFGIGLDVTERRELREQLSRALQQLRLVFDSLPTPVAYIDTERRYRFGSKVYERWMGRPLAEIEGRTIEEVLGAGQYARVRPFVERALAGEHVTFDQELEYPGIGTRSIRASFVPHTGPDGRVLGYISLVTDVTEQRRVEQMRELVATGTALLSTSLDYETTLASITHMVIPALADVCVIDVYEQDGGLRRVAAEHRDPALQPAMRRLLAYGPRYADGDPRRQALNSGEALLLPSIDDDFLRRTASDDEHYALAKQLDTRSLLIAPICVGREVLGVMQLGLAGGVRTYNELDRQTAEEIGRRAGTAIANARLFGRTQEAAEALAEANAAKDEFLALVSHELRTPLTTISGNADVLVRAGGLLTEDQREQALGDIRRDAERLQALVENMLMLSRIGSSDVDLEPTMAPHVIEERVAAYRARHRGRPFHVDAPHGLPVVLAERTALEHIIDNLLSNATKYSPPGSPVEIRVEQRRAALAITVADRGFGISTTEPLFEPFYRSRDAALSVPGLGLGLTVCKRLVEVHGGEIWARPRDGGGSEFTFTLPVLREPIEA